MPCASAAFFASTVKYGPRNSVTTVVENAEFAKSYIYHPRCSRALYMGRIIVSQRFRRSAGAEAIYSDSTFGHVDLRTNHGPDQPRRPTRRRMWIFRLRRGQE